MLKKSSKTPILIILSFVAILLILMSIKIFSNGFEILNRMFFYNVVQNVQPDRIYPDAIKNEFSDLFIPNSGEITNIGKVTPSGPFTSDTHPWYFIKIAIPDEKINEFKEKNTTMAESSDFTTEKYQYLMDEVNLKWWSFRYDEVIEYYLTFQHRDIIICKSENGIIDIFIY